MNYLGKSQSGESDIGWFLIAWTIYTAIMCVGAMRINGGLALTFVTLLIGFVLLDLAHFGFPFLTTVAACELIVTAFLAWYVMAHIIFVEVFGKDVLPVGEKWIK